VLTKVTVTVITAAYLWLAVCHIPNPILQSVTLSLTNISKVLAIIKKILSNTLSNTLAIIQNTLILSNTLATTHNTLTNT